jgi:hypothetical protein
MHILIPQGIRVHVNRGVMANDTQEGCSLILNDDTTAADVVPDLLLTLSLDGLL